MSNSTDSLWNEVSTMLFKKGVELENASLLVGVSCGLDSTVLAHLLSSHHIHIELAHVNYHLRGAESNDDEQFLRAFAKDRGLQIHVLSIDTGSEPHPTSGLQNWARNKRYAWFEQLRQERKLDWIAVAHHRSDQVETVLHQFIRGGMLPALRGMKLVREHIIRPLLHTSREDILTYAQQHQLVWREDSSNLKLDYTRNKIRHQIIPSIEQLNPGFANSIATRSELFAEMEQLVYDALDAEIKKVFQTKGESLYAKAEALSQYPYAQLLIWRVMQPFGFTSHQSHEALKILSSETHASLHTATHSFWCDRGEVTIAPRKEVDPVFFHIPSHDFHCQHPFFMQCEVVSNEQVAFSGHKMEAFLSLKKLHFPLTVRSWREGDKFQPLGMTGHQKISDLLIQKKIPLKDKPGICVLESEGQIAWVLGIRMSEQFKVCSDDAQVMRILIDRTPKP